MIESMNGGIEYMHAGAQVWDWGSGGAAIVNLATHLYFRPLVGPSKELYILVGP